ncbi:restriction endonuclease subunit S [Haloferax sp. KTX1]|uniref:restriction endonuclease subunit S n=1 Tax=Haloferax sp. KTX1 TaxID=2600597 RepID=UPI0011DD4D8D|nr:restriction endonuclease subunit S [Haloferax sp. KTX1]
MSEEVALDEVQSESEDEQGQKWQKVRLGDVSRKRSENVDPQEVNLDRHVGLEHIDPSTPYPEWESVDGLSSTKRRFEAGDILFAKLRPNLEKSAQPDFEGVASTDIFPIVAEEGVNSKYLLYRLSSKPAYDHARRTSAGTRMPRTSWNLFSNFEFDLPPLEEQRRIATVLQDVDQSIQKTEEIIEQATRVRKGIMQDLFRYGLNESGELRGSAEGTEPYRKTKYGEIPESWDVIALSQLVPEDAPIVYGILKPGDHQPDGIPVVKVKDIHNGEVKQRDILHTSQEIHEDFKRAELREGDLLFTIRGTVGRMAFVPESLDGGNITQDTARIRVTGANPRFIRYFFETETPNNYFERNTIGQAVQGINLEDLREVPVHLPPEEEQDRIVEIIDHHSKKLRNERDYLQRLQRFKQGLMQDLLSGTVRTTDTNIAVLDEVLQHG